VLRRAYIRACGVAYFGGDRISLLRSYDWFYISRSVSNCRILCVTGSMSELKCVHVGANVHVQTPLLRGYVYRSLEATISSETVYCAIIRRKVFACSGGFS
jgi:hypothetical protein